MWYIAARPIGATAATHASSALRNRRPVPPPRTTAPRSTAVGCPRRPTTTRRHNTQAVFMPNLTGNHEPVTPSRHECLQRPHGAPQEGRGRGQSSVLDLSDSGGSCTIRTGRSVQQGPFCACASRVRRARRPESMHMCAEPTMIIWRPTFPLHVSFFYSSFNTQHRIPRHGGDQRRSSREYFAAQMW